MGGVYMIINFSPILKNNKIFNTKQVALYPNLAPLSKDTVSFSGSNPLNSASMKYAPNAYMCHTVVENAAPAEHYLQTVLHKYLDEYVADSSNSVSQSKPILNLGTRVKSASSIREKVASKYWSMLKKESSNFTNAAIDEIAKYFDLVEGVNEDAIKSTIKSVTTDSFLGRRIPLFQNADSFLPKIITSLDKINAFQFDNVPLQQKRVYFRRAVESLQEIKCNNSVIDNKYIDPMTIEGIKHYAQDIVGARIVLGESSYASTGRVLNAIAQASKDGLLKIKQIEAHIPDEKRIPLGSSISDFLYATDEQLKQLERATGAKFITNVSKSGYMGIHLDIELNDESICKNEKFAGYCGEIQIMGRDVELLKDVEDLCYKLKDNKGIVHEAYEDFKKHFLTYYKGDTVKKNFNDYTHDLFLKQRIISPRTKLSGIFPSIEEMNYKGKVPEALDFNLLRSMKAKADNEKDKIEKAAYEASVSSREKSSKSKMKRQNEIKDAIGLINYKFSQL